MPDEFQVNLLKGRLLGEGPIALWFIKRGYCVLPAYDIEINTGKGPRLFTTAGGIIVPDLLVFNSERVVWIEAKSKNAFTWFRIGKTWQDGVDKKHWLDYLRIAEITPWPVWILFMHQGNGVAKDTPINLVPPTGLFGQDIQILKDRIDHESDRHARGMVYWNIDDFKRFPN